VRASNLHNAHDVSREQSGTIFHKVDHKIIRKIPRTGNKITQTGKKKPEKLIGNLSQNVGS